MITLVFVIAVITIVYFLVRKNYQYWESRGVSGPKPTFLVGNMGKSFIMKANPGEVFAKIYNDYSDSSAVGLYRSFSPILLIRDPELIKEVTTKSFGHFRNNDIELDKNHDLLFGRNPFVLKGNEWKTVRGYLTPAFTSGKMKYLYPYLESNSKKMVKFLEDTPEATDGRGFQAKDLSSRFTLSNVANSIFGIEAKCFDDEDNEFKYLARNFLAPDSRAAFLLFLAMTFPMITKFVPIRWVPKLVEKKLIDLVAETVKYREENNVVLNDFLQILTQLKKSVPDFTDLDVAAHAAGFFGDGYETSSMVLSFAIFDVACNPEVQQKLREEVGRVFDDNNDTLPYEDVQSLQYLEAVINESLRLNPPIFHLQKRCTEAFTLTLKENNKKVNVEPGTPIILPVLALHKDPQYFEDASLFKPERFVGENKERIQKCTFLPFGEGPRMCLGQRFGMLQVKVGLAYLVRNYEMSVNGKTKLPLKFDPANLLATPIGGLWIDFKKIA